MDRGAHDHRRREPCRSFAAHARIEGFRSPDAALPAVALALGIAGDVALGAPLVWARPPLRRLRRSLCGPPPPGARRGALAGGGAALTARPRLAWRASPVLQTLDVVVFAVALGLLPADRPDRPRSRPRRAPARSPCTRRSAPPLVARLPGRGCAWAPPRGSPSRWPAECWWRRRSCSCSPSSWPRRRGFLPPSAELIAIDLWSVVRHLAVAALLSCWGRPLERGRTRRRAELPRRPPGCPRVPSRPPWSWAWWTSSSAASSGSSSALVRAPNDRHRGRPHLLAVRAQWLLRAGHRDGPGPAPLLLAHWVVPPAARGRRVMLATGRRAVALVLVIWRPRSGACGCIRRSTARPSCAFYTPPSCSGWRCSSPASC